MKKFYLLILALGFISLGYAQEKDSSAPRNPNYRALVSRPSQKVKHKKDIEDFRLFPNPVTDGIVAIHTRKNLPKAISIYDVLGKEVLRTKITGKTLNVSILNSGIYIIKVTETDNTSTRKLVVK
ncbi:T9SS type A sorting domain-containing protein [Sinomicrobium weinanense]|uniref:T9SS type A sorting domain-containing protein n=1 Tax=Sinomicrobium weinanense TaxID=2842200 RepID=A0A926JVI4_9FLAO|nr:T9SS type A sorting domain-containing protein [Sinomicrobium weinanense]MBC9797967.1 T9SS type A sorting domain-containing protein [Sinomicrobium weinanense]MBU3123097.1 T9SS type A sorting domain-containing protein [Sinomicrobium weinanense]